MSEICNVRLAVYGAEHSKCNHTITLGFKRLTPNDYRPYVSPFSDIEYEVSILSFMLYDTTLHLLMFNSSSHTCVTPVFESINGSWLVSGDCVYT